MFTVIADVIDSAEAEAVRGVLETAAFVDGRATAGWHAKLVKNNLQAGAGNKDVAQLRESIAAKVAANPIFRLVARPKTLSPLILSRYEPGMAYGSHVDDALMGGVRTDLAFTLFLADPESYDGGALVIEDACGEQDVSCRRANCSSTPRPRFTAWRRSPPGCAWPRSAGCAASSAMRAGARCCSTWRTRCAACTPARASRPCSTRWSGPAPICCACGPTTDPALPYSRAVVSHGNSSTSASTRSCRQMNGPNERKMSIRSISGGATLFR